MENENLAVQIDTDRHQTELWITWKEWVALNARRNFEMAQALYKNEQPAKLPDRVRVRKSSKRKSGEHYVSDVFANAGS